MKRSTISATVLSAVFMSAGALAANGVGALTINGVVENSSCCLKNNDARSTITLPNIDASRFSDLSTGVTVGDEKKDNDSTPMVIVYSVDIELNTVRITGTQFTSGVLNEAPGDANGVGFNLTLSDKQITDAKESSLKNELTARGTNDGIGHTLDFKAKYACLSSDISVTTGTLSSVLTISVSADQISMPVSSPAIH